MSDENDLGKRLIAQDGISQPHEAAQRRRHMKDLMEQERRTGRRIRTAALTTWGLAVAGLSQFGILMILSRSNPDGPNVGLELAAVAALVIGSSSLIVAATTTIAWLFRSRAPTLAAIDLRLAALEDLLIASRDRASDGPRDDPEADPPSGDERR